MARNLLFSNNQREEGYHARAAYRFSPKTVYSTHVSFIQSSPERNQTFLVHHIDLPYLDIDHSFRMPIGDKASALFDLNLNQQKKFLEAAFEDITTYSGALLYDRHLSKNWNFIFEAEYQLGDLDSNPLIFPQPDLGITKGKEGATVKNETYHQAAFLATLARSSSWSISADFEMTTFDRELDEQSITHKLVNALSDGWASLYLTIQALKRHQINIWGGQRKERVICSGGTCRIEPAFEGLELTWTAQF